MSSSFPMASNTSHVTPTRRLMEAETQRIQNSTITKEDTSKSSRSSSSSSLFFSLVVVVVRILELRSFLLLLGLEEMHRAREVVKVPYADEKVPIVMIEVVQKLNK